MEARDGALPLANPAAGYADTELPVAPSTSSAKAATSNRRHRRGIWVEDKLVILEKRLNDFTVTVTFTCSDGQRTPNIGDGEICLPACLLEELEDTRVRLSALHDARDAVSDERIQQRVISCKDQVDAAIEACAAWRSIPISLRRAGACREFLTQEAKLAFDNAQDKWLQQMTAVSAETYTLHAKEAVVSLSVAMKTSSDLGAVREQLELCDNSIDDYMEKRRMEFSRFNFVSTDALCNMLADAERPENFNAEAGKFQHGKGYFSDLFSALEALEFGGDQSVAAVGMRDQYDEIVEWDDPVTCAGEVCSWLTEVEAAMRFSLQRELHERLETYSTVPYREWVRTGCHQMRLLASAVEHTTALNECFDRIDHNSLATYRDQCRANLHLLEDLIKGRLPKIQRRSINVLLIMSMQHTEEVESLIRVGATDVLCYERQAQLQHRVDHANHGSGTAFCSGDTVCVRIGDCERHYGFEYLGQYHALVFTQCTDKVFVGLTTAMRLRVSGLLTGPAGTGKTETTKGLARHFGVMFHVFNCSDQMTYKLLGELIRGVAACGCWGCFDEFNRIEISVLAVVAAQVRCIHDALRVVDTTPGPHKFTFEGTPECRLVPTVFIVASMNKGYVGRGKLPAALEAEFRCFTMIPPDNILIVEGMLLAEGFSATGARELSRKVDVWLKRSQDRMSKQYHYDFGLRFIKTLLCDVGKKYRVCNKEVFALREAVHSILGPMLIAEDLAMLPMLLDETLPCSFHENDVSTRRTLDLLSQSAIVDSALKLDYQPTDVFVKKVSQLHGVMQSRHAMALLGPAGSGKTAIRKTLVCALEAVSSRDTANQSKQGSDSWTTVNVVEIYPKSMGMDELYGAFDTASGQWADGALPYHFRKLAGDKESRQQLLVLDGAPDPIWLENLNTVMDDNKVLCLANNERVCLPPTMRVLFEWSSAAVISPATVSRVGCCYVGSSDIGWEPALQSWLDAQEESHRCLLEGLAEIYLPKALDKARQLAGVVCAHEGTQSDMSIDMLNAVETLCALLDATLIGAGQHIRKDCIHLRFVFACIWAVGGSLSTHESNTNSRAEFSRWWLDEFDDKHFKAMKLKFSATETLEAVQFPVDSDGEHRQSVFHCKVDGQMMVPWPVDESPVAISSDRMLYVHTQETTRLSFLFNLLVPNGAHLLLVGGPGVGKTAIMNANLSDRNSATMDGVALTDSCSVWHDFITQSGQDQMQEQQCTFFFDDFNVRACQYGNKPPEELLRSFIEGHLYDPTLLDLDKGRGLYWYGKVITTNSQANKQRTRDCNIVSALNPAVGNRMVASLQRHFAIFACETTSDCLRSICSCVLCEHVADFNANLVVSAAAVASACATTYTLVRGIRKSGLLQAFNLRHIAALLSGMRRCNANTCKCGQDLFDLFVHESRRVFRDALCSDEDTHEFDEQLAKVSGAYSAFVETGTFPPIAQIVEMVPEQQHFDYNAKVNLFCSFANPENNYAAISHEALPEVLRQTLGHQADDVVLFFEATEYLVRIVRIIEKPGGHAALIGTRGTGKRTMARLAAQICACVVAEPSTLDDVRTTCIEGRAGSSTRVLLLVTDQANNCVMRLVSELMGSNEKTTLFRDDINLAKARDRLRIVLCFENCTGVFSEFPKLATLVCIFFRPWSGTALVAVASHHLSRLAPADLDAAQRQSLAHFMVNVLYSVARSSEKTGSSINLLTSEGVSGGDLLTFMRQYTTMLRTAIAEVTERREVIKRALSQMVLTQSNGVGQLTQACTSAAAEWREELNRIVVKEQTLTGDTLLAAAFVCFAGPFPPEARASLVKTWIAGLEQQHISVATANITRALSSPSDWERWESDGLQCDEFSRQNAAVVEQTLRCPLLIDPHGQGLQWLRRMHNRKAAVGERITQDRERKLVQVNAMEEGFVDRMADAAENGEAVAVEVGRVIDVQLQPFIASGKGCDAIRIGARDLYIDPRFQIYLFTAAYEAPFDPECTIVNFKVSESSLQQQVSQVVQTEELQELMQQRAQLADKVAASRQMSEDLLAVLDSDNSNINDSKLRTLYSSPDNPAGTQLAALTTELTRVESRIDETRMTLCEAVQSISLAISMILDLHHRDLTYQFSLSTCLEIVHVASRSIISADTQDVNALRDEVMTKVCVVQLLTLVRGALDVNEYVQFAFELCFAMEARCEHNNLDLGTLALLGNRIEVLGAGYPKLQSESLRGCPDWLPLRCWAACTALASAKPDIFGSLPSRLTRGEERSAWRKWYCEGCAMPGAFSNTERLLLLRCFRPDLLHDELLSFVGQSRYCGEPALRQVGCNLTERLKAVKSSGAVLFLHGVDELESVVNMRDALLAVRGNNVLETVQLGQGRYGAAMRSLQQASDPKRSGGWVLIEDIQNDDNQEPIIPQLITLCETLASGGGSIHPAFRLFMSFSRQQGVSRADPWFPLLKLCTKLSTEPSMQSQIDQCKAVQKHVKGEHPDWSRVSHAAALFHSVVVERRRYGELCWLVPPQCGRKELEHALRILCGQLDRAFHDKSQVPWSEVKRTVVLLTYGETFDPPLACDLMQLESIAERYLRPVVCPRNEAETAKLPDLELPDGDPHLEAEFHSVKAIAICSRSFQGSADRAIAQAGEFDNWKHLVNKIPKLDTSIRSSIGSIKLHEAFQSEVEQMQKILKKIEKSLSKPTPDERKSLLAGLVPLNWFEVKHTMREIRMVGCPRNNLVELLETLLAHAQQLELWGQMGSLNSYWLPGFLDPGLFVTVIQQEAAKAAGRSLSEVQVEAAVSDYDNPADVVAPPLHGAFIHGLTVENASWDRKNRVLIHRPSTQRFNSLPPPVPVIHMFGSTAGSALQEGVDLACPVVRIRRTTLNKLTSESLSPALPNGSIALPLVSLAASPVFTLRLRCSDCMSVSQCSELAVRLVCDGAQTIDQQKRFDIHTICAHSMITPHMLRQAGDRCTAEQWTTTDDEGRTPLHLLCDNKEVTAQLLHIANKQLSCACLPTDRPPYLVEDKFGVAPLDVLALNAAADEDVLKAAAVGSCNVENATARNAAARKLMRQKKLTVAVFKEMVQAVNIAPSTSEVCNIHQNCAQTFFLSSNDDHLCLVDLILMRKAPATAILSAARTIEWLLCKELWHDPSGRNPLSCAVWLHDKEAVELLVKGLVERKMVHEVRGLQHNIALLLRANNYPEVGCSLLQSGGLLAIPTSNVYRFSQDEIEGVYGESNVLKDCLTVDTSTTIKASTPLILHSIQPGDSVRIGAREGVVRRLHGYQREVRNCPGAENRVSIVPYLYVQWDGDNSTSLVKASRVSVRRDAQKWLDLRARVEANRSATGASSAFEVDAVVVAVRNAAKAGYDGLLGTLLEADTVDAFGTPICSILIDYKWNKFARTYFMVRLFMRLFLVAAWTYLCTVVVSVEKPFAHVTGVRSGSAVALCAVGGAYWQARVSSHLSRTQLIPTVLSMMLILGTQIGGFVCLGGSDQGVTDWLARTAMVVLVTTTTASFIDELKEIRGAVKQALERSAVASTNQLKLDEQRIPLESIYDVPSGVVSGFLKHLLNPWNLIDMVSLTLITVFIVRILTGANSQGRTAQIAAMTSMLLWFRFIAYLQGFEASAKFVSYIFRVTQDMLVFLCIMLILAVGNIFVSQLLWPHRLGDAAFRGEWNITDDDREQMDLIFGDLGHAVFSSLELMFAGSFETSLLDKAFSPILAYTNHIYQGILVPLIMLNLLIALMGSSHGRVEENEENEGKRKRAELINDIEHLLSHREKKEMFPEWIFLYRQKEPEGGQRAEPSLGILREEMERKMANLDAKLDALTSTLSLLMKPNQ